MKKTKRKIKYSRGLSPVMLLAFIVLLALLAVLAVRFAQRHNTEADEHDGMVQVYNGERSVWIVPQDGVLCAPNRKTQAGRTSCPQAASPHSLPRGAPIYDQIYSQIKDALPLRTAPSLFVRRAG